MHPFKVYGALVMVQVLFGLWPVVGLHAMGVLTPSALVGFRTLLAAPVLLMLGGRGVPSGSDLLRLAVLGFFGVSANQLLYAEGLIRAGVVNAVIITVSIPVVALMVSALLERRLPTRRRGLGVLLTFAGVLVLVRVERFDLADQKHLGNLLVLANSSLYAVYLVLAKPVFARVGALRSVGWVFVFGALEALPWTFNAVASTPWLSLSGDVWGSLAFILVGATIGTYALNAYALKYADSAVVAVFIGLQPLVGALAAWLAFSEVPSLRTAVAGVLVFGGVMLASWTGPLRISNQLRSS